MTRSSKSLWTASASNAFETRALESDRTVDIAIIGGGFTGCSAALEAAKQGVSTALFEAKTIGFGASGRNVGLVNAGTWLKPSEVKKAMGDKAGTALVEYLSQGPQVVFDIIKSEGISCEATRNGTLHLAHSPEGVKGLEDRFRQGNALGAPITLLDREETIKRTGSEAFYGALFDPRAGTIQPLSYVQGLAKAAQNHGAVIYQNTPVDRFHHDGEMWLLQIGAQTVKAKSLFLATNAYNSVDTKAAAQYATVHYCQFATRPLTPEEAAGILQGGEGCWDTATVMSSIRMDEARRLIIGGVGNSEGLGGRIHARWAKRKLAEYYPQLKDLELEYHWSGRIAMTQNFVPKIVNFGPNALTIFGYSGRGIGTGTLFGRSAATALLSGDMSVLPVAPLTSYREHAKALRSAYYETGATLTHAIYPNAYLNEL